jgi:hypothetical protein
MPMHGRPCLLEGDGSATGAMTAVGLAGGDHGLHGTFRRRPITRYGRRA